MAKTAVITGGAGGIGMAIATALLDEQVSVALVDIDSQALAKAKQQLSTLSSTNVSSTENSNTSSKPSISTHCADVSDAAAMQALVDAVIAEHGQVDYLFNNAGLTITRAFKSYQLEHWQKIIGVNLWSVIYSSHYFLPALEKTQGSIINISSLAGFLGLPYQAGYSLTKSAVRSLSESLYAELKHSGVHVMCVHPGAVRTAIIEKAIEDSDNPKLTQQLAKLTAKTAIEPELLAKKIIRAVKRKKQRLVVGLDAHAVEILKRLMPSMLHSLFAQLFARTMAKQTSADVQK
ncbi:MAG: SDR family oxidoreductase [Pseudomonadales bacterium]|nr:SDR family oxidoreductase [Pseudomonadales bacterium]